MGGNRLRGPPEVQIRTHPNRISDEIFVGDPCNVAEHVYEVRNEIRIFLRYLHPFKDLWEESGTTWDHMDQTEISPPRAYVPHVDSSSTNFVRGYNFGSGVTNISSEYPSSVQCNRLTGVNAGLS